MRGSDFINYDEKINEMFVEVINKEIAKLEGDKGKISDGNHTFSELYYHRMMLFAVICNIFKDQAWKSRLHDDGTMFDNHFIVGITTPEGNYTYHYHINRWDLFDVKELEYAPEWDGHVAYNVTRLFSLM